MQPFMLICVAASTIIPSVSSFYYKRTFYGDANSNGNVNNYNYNNYEQGDHYPDYVNAYYGFPSFPSQEHRRRPSFGLYPPQNFFRHEHPFDFGPLGHRIGDANEQPQPMPKTDRERVMEKAKPGFWKQNGRGENMNRVKKIINQKRMDMDEKHMQIRKALANERDEIRSKFADLHKRLIEKNFKMMATFIPRNKSSESIVSSASSITSSSQSSTVSAPEPDPVAVPELSKQAKKIEKEAKKIMENKKMSIETKQEKLDKLMLKAPDNVKAELVAINDSSAPSSSAAPSALPLVQYPSQQSLSASSPSLSIVESRPIRISEDGQTVEI